MRTMKKFGTAAVAAAMLMAVGAGSASAANWDPAGTLTGHGSLTLTGTPGGASVTCTVHVSVTSTGNDLATTTPVFSNCSNTIIPGNTTATSNTTWRATATSTTSVDVTGGAVISIFFGACTITATDVSLAGNTWSNGTSTLTANSVPTIPITESGLCDGSTSAHMSGSIVVPGASIT